MSVSTSTSKISYTLTTGSQALTVPFRFLSNSHVKAVKAGETPLTLVENTDYTLTGVGATSGTLTTIATVGNGLEAGSIVVIKRNVPITQETSYTYNGDFPSAVQEAVEDKLTMIAQQIDEKATRSLHFPEDDLTEAELPSAADRANKAIGFNSTGTSIEMKATVDAGGVLATESVGEAEIQREFRSQRADSISALRSVSIAGAFTGDRAQVMDGTGRPDYKLSKGQPAGTYVDNGFSTIVPTGGDGSAAWLWDWSGYITPEWCGAKGDGIANDTTSLQLAINSGYPVELTAGKTYAITKGASYYVLTSPASLILRGNGATIKLVAAAADCCILGSASEITSVKISDTTFNGNKASVSAVGTVGVYFPNIHRFESRNNIYTGFKNTGSVTVPTGGKGIFLGNVTQCEWAISDADMFTNMDHHGFQSYRTLQQTVKDGFFNGHIVSCIDTNPLTAPGQNDRTKISITNNVINCGGGFTENFSVISLMGDDVECVGNKITGGQFGIVIHTASGYTGSLRNYNVSENYLWNQLATGISAAQDVNSSITIRGNHVYKTIGSAISVFGNYSGPYTKTEGLISITDNHVYDGVVGSTYTQTNEPAGIKLSGVFNTTVSGNQIYKPRFAGVQIICDSQNVVISNNVITDHSGQASTTAPTFTGGGIVISDEGTYALLSSIIIEANIIKNYLTADAGSSSIRTGGIVVNGGGTNVADVTVRDNIIDNGNGNGISVYNTTRTVLQNNTIRNYYNAPIVLNTAADTIWAEGQVNSKIGTTGNRPAAPGNGATYFDTTLGKPIWWNGANWKDATGTTV